MENWSVEVLKMSNEMRNNLRAVAKARGETTQEAILNAVSFYIEANLSSFSGEETKDDQNYYDDNLENTTDKKRPRKDDYFDFFSKKLKNPRVNFLTGDLMHELNGSWQHVENYIQSLRAEATVTNFLKKSDVKDYLDFYRDSLPLRLLVDIPAWDGIDRIKQIAQCLTATNLDQTMIEEVIKEWGAKMFERIENHNTRNQMLVFTGNQYQEKDDLVKALVSGFDYYYKYGSLVFSGKKYYENALMDSLVWYVDELDVSKKIDSYKLKKIINRSEVNIYGKNEKDIKCRYSMVASCNSSKFLQDNDLRDILRVIELTHIEPNFPREQSLQVLAQFEASKYFRVSSRTLNAIDDFYKKKTTEEKIIIEFDNLMRTHCSTGYLEGPKQRELINRLSRMFSVTTRAVYSAVKASGRSYMFRNNTLRIFLPENDPRLNKVIDVQSDVDLDGKIIKLFDNYMAMEKKQYIDAEHSEPMKRYIYDHVNPYYLKITGEMLTERRVNEVLKQAGRCKLHRDKFLRYSVITSSPFNQLTF